MVPGASKRPAASPPADESRMRKKFQSSSPEEGEVDDAPEVPAYRTPTPPRLPAKPEMKVKFPFKKKAAEDSDIRDGPSALRLEERPRDDDMRPREADKRRSTVGVIVASGPSRDRNDRDWNERSYAGDRSPYVRDKRLERPRSISPVESPEPRRNRRDRDRDRGRSSFSTASPRSTSSSDSRSPSRRRKHRLPPARTGRQSVTPPRIRRRDRSYEAEERYPPPRNIYSRPLDDPINNWKARDSRAQYRREPLDDYDSGDRFYRRRPPSPLRSYIASPRLYHDQRRRDTYVPHYDDDRGGVRRRDLDSYRPISPGPIPLPPRPRSLSSRVALSPPRPPPRSPSTPPHRPSNAVSQGSTTSPAPPRAEPPPAPKNVHSPTPLSHSLPGAVASMERTKRALQMSPPPRVSRSGPYRSRVEEQKIYGRMFVGSGQQSDYDATTKLGEGTFGEVHKAKHRPTGNIVALKRILMHNEKEGMPVTALREIKILKALKHPNIVELLDMFVVRSKGKEQPLSVYMVFPYMDHDLAGLLENERVGLQPSQIKLYMKQLLEGTEYMHQNHILHRDMKAANLLISNNGSLRIADFGLARSYDPNAALISETATDSRSKERRYTNCVVTRWYRPPELLLGARHYGGEIDLWGIGCVLGEMFLRHPILPGTSDLDQLEKIWQMCGTPNQHTWPNFDTLPGCEGVKHHNQFSKRLKPVFEQFGTETCDLIDKLLTCNPRDRITASQALEHDYFWTDPLPADPKTLPNYEASHEFDKRGRRQQPRPAVIHQPPPPEAFRPMPPPLMSQPPPIHLGRGPPPRESFHQAPLPIAYPQQLPPISFSHNGPPRHIIPPPNASFPPTHPYPTDHRMPYGVPPPGQYPPPQRPPHQNRPPPWAGESNSKPPTNRPAHLPPRPPAPLGANGTGGGGSFGANPRRGGRDSGHQSGASSSGGLNYG